MRMMDDFGPPPDLPPEAYADYGVDPVKTAPAPETPRAEAHVADVFTAGETPDLDEAFGRATEARTPKAEPQAVGWGTYRRLIDQGVDRRTALNEAVRALRGEGGEPW